MKVLLVTRDFPPVLNSAARIFFELAQDLKNHGFIVAVLTQTAERYLAIKAGKRKRFIAKERIGEITIYRLISFSAKKGIIFLRALDHLWTSFAFLLAGLYLNRYDVIIVYSPPLPLALTGYIFSKLWKAKLIVNVQDIYPQTVIDLGLLKNKFLIQIFQKLELFVYRKAEAITAHSEGNKNFIISRGAPADKVHVIENWVDLEYLRPGKKNNSWREVNGLNSAFIISFAGTIGYAQGLMDVLNVAKSLKNYSEIVFFIVGDGALRPKIEKVIENEKLNNIRLLSHQPPEIYKEILQASDICLVTLDKNLRTPVVPGKLQSIMAIGRPAICIANPASDAKRIIEEAKCGYFLPPDDIHGIKSAILEIYRNKDIGDQMGRNGRIYAEKFFDRKKCTQKYVRIISNLKGR